MSIRIAISKIVRSRFGQLALRITPNSVRKSLKALVFGPPSVNSLDLTFDDNQSQQLDLWMNSHFGKQSSWIEDNAGGTLLFSIILPVFKVQVEVFQKLLDSLLNQSFKDFEVCIAAHGVSEEILTTIKKAVDQDQLKIKLDTNFSNYGISATSNACLSLATGDYIVLLDHDDELPSHALASIANSIEQNPNSIMFYTDKRTITENGHTVDVLLKQNWSPETLLSANYLTHLNAIRTSTVRDIGGWDSDTDGAQDWDLFLRIALMGQKITHVPVVCYSWRQVETSVSLGGSAAKPYIFKAQEKALQKYLDKITTGAIVKIDEEGYSKISWSSSKYTVAIGHEQFHEIKEGLRIGKLAWPDDAIVIMGSENSFQIRSGDFSEIAGILQNIEVTCSTGIFVNPSGQVIDGARVRLKNEEVRPVFWDVPTTHSGPFGSLRWMRNASHISDSIFALRFGDLRRVIESAKTVSDLPKLLGDIGRLVSNPRLIVELSLTANTPPSTGEIDDPYFQGDCVMGLNQPEPRYISPPLEHAKDTYEQQADYFIRSLPKKVSFDNPEKLDHISKVAWLVPGFSSTGYGGIRSIFRFANYLSGLGIHSDFYVNGTTVSNKLKKDIITDFSNLKNSKFTSYPTGQILNLEKYDLAIATLWTTAYDLAAASGLLKRVYLVQDFEPDFYPSGTLKLLTFNSYKLGLHHIANTEGLAKVLGHNGIKATYFNPGLDFSIFNDKNRSRDSSEVVRIFFYMRPNHSRNCFDLNLAVIRQLKARFGSRIEIVCAGSEFDPNVYNISHLINYVGFMHYAETGELYRSIDIGVSLMASSHPSYPPLEMMACATVVVTNQNPATSEFFSEKNAVVVPPITDEIVETIAELIQKPEVRKKLSSSASAFARESIQDWKNVSQEFHSLIKG